MPCKQKPKMRETGQLEVHDVEFEADNASRWSLREAAVKLLRGVFKCATNKMVSRGTCSRICAAVLQVNGRPPALRGRVGVLQVEFENKDVMWPKAQS